MHVILGFDEQYNPRDCCMRENTYPRNLEGHKVCGKPFDSKTVCADVEEMEDVI